MTSATITHVHVADPAGVEYASESASKHEATVALREPVVYRQQGLLGVHAARRHPPARNPVHERAEDRDVVRGRLRGLPLTERRALR